MRASLSGARVVCSSVRFASRSGRRRSIRPLCCAAFSKRCAMMPLIRPFAAAAACESYARALHARSRE
eukprot:8005420-Lingulodinium_polyedra.AAC.1